MIRKIAIIRDRGQLTIPDQIRRMAQWTGASSAVVFLMDKSDEIRIVPHQSARGVEWENLFGSIEKARGTKGKGRIGSSEFIIKMRRA